MQRIVDASRGDVQPNDFFEREHPADIRLIANGICRHVTSAHDDGCVERRNGRGSPRDATRTSAGSTR